MRKLVLLSSLLILLTNLNGFAQQDWYWKSPNPQGNSIKEIFTGNNVLFGIGDCSTVISTSNTGASWKVLNKLTGGDDNITSFQKFDENTYYLGTSYNRMQRSTNGGLTWFGTALIYEGNSTSIKGIAYTSSSIGYAITSKKIFKTGNSGAIWNLLLTLTDDITSINFINNNTGFVTTMGGMEGGFASIYKTTNGGMNWIQTVFEGWAEEFKIIKFINGNTGFIRHGGIRNNGSLYKTTNQGSNWNVVGTNGGLGRIHVFDENNFLATDYYNFKITTNGGASWIIKKQPYMEPRDMHFESPQKGYLLDYNNRISVTENGGNNWAEITESNGNSFSTIEFLNENTGFICGRNNYVKKTTDAGETWINYEAGLAGGISGMDFIDANTGFVSGTNNWQINISKTTNGGMNFITSFVYDANIGTKVKFINANTGFLAGRFYFFRTSNSGDSWQRLFLQDSIEINSIEFIDENTGLLTGKLYQSFVTKVYRTTNAGLTWNPVYSTTNTLYDQMGEIKMVNSLKGYIDGYGIWTTENGGVTWVKLYTTGLPQNAYVHPMEFINGQTGYVSTSGSVGLIYKTTNGGFHWATGSVPTNSRLSGIKFLNSNTGIVAGTNGVMLKTTNGGGIFLSDVTTLSNSVVSEYKLHQNYPNPFNPVTNIQFDIPKGGFVMIKVYDILGKEVANLLSDIKPAGSYMVSFDAGRLSSGVYFYKMETNGFIQTKRMLLLK